MIYKVFETTQEFNDYTSNGTKLKSDYIYFVEDTGKFMFYTNNIDGEAKVYTVYGCTNLSSVIESSVKNIVIPDGTTKIGENAFHSCTELTKVTIPESVTEISKNAFVNCGKLVNITINATTPPTLDAQALDSDVTGRVIYVPAESVDTYKSATNWSVYADSIQAITE